MRFKIIGNSLIYIERCHEIIEGENDYEPIEIEAPRYKNGLDLSAMDFLLKATLADGSGSSEPQVLEKRTNGNELLLLGTVSDDISALVGKVYFSLTGTNDINVTAKFSGTRAVPVKPDRGNAPGHAGSIISDDEISPDKTWSSEKISSIFLKENSHNVIWRNSDITADYDSGAFSEHVADGSFDDIYMGDYIEKTVTIDGEPHNVKGYVVHCDPFFGGYDSYAVVNTHHVGLFIVGLPNHNMNDKVNNAETTAGGYAGSGMHAWLTDTVLPALETAFGAEHLLAHQKIFSNLVDVNAANRSGGRSAGASNSWNWATNQKISLLTEAQVRGTTVWSSSAYDTGEACNQLAAFRLVNPQCFTGNTWWWLRDVASATDFVRCDYSGYTRYANASGTIKACPLILLK